MNEYVERNGFGQPGGVAVIDQQQAQIFGEDVALYERFRPSYPRDLIEAVVTDTVAPDNSYQPILEIGAGTGKATQGIVTLGKRVHALEPDPRMAARLRQNCPDGQVAVDLTTLEAADLTPASYSLVVAAQAWHWVDPEIGYDLVADALVPNGRLALLWHHPDRRQGLFGRAMAQLYAQVAPQIVHRWPGQRAADFDPAKEPVSATKRFKMWSRLEHRWERHLDAANLIGWLCSTSEHRMLPIGQRSELMASVAALVDEMGGTVTIGMTTVAHLARRV